MSDNSSRSPCHYLADPMVVVLACKTLFPLLILLPNLQTSLCWMESNLTILINPLTPFAHPILIPSNMDWEPMVVIASHQLSQNLLINIDLVNLQGSFFLENPPSRQITLHLIIPHPDLIMLGQNTQMLVREV